MTWRHQGDCPEKSDTIDMHESANGALGVDSTGKSIASHIITSVMNSAHLDESPWSAKTEKVPTALNRLTSLEQILTDPYRYLHSKPGKDIRAHMIASFNVWLQVPDLALQIITRVVEMLHTSSLLLHILRKRRGLMYRIDDVEDGSTLRRGFPVAHSIFGVPQTINSANYIYFCALRELERLNNPRLFKIFYGTI